MADLTLRGQYRRSVNLLSADQAAEAVTVCRRILETFPKHIDTYSVLARAYLMLGEHEKAISLLQRVLSADPEHVEARLTLAAIGEEQGLADETLWHLRRAFELSPGSVEIRRELCRIYKERGLSVGGRVKLTRGALARIYMRGQLYSKAAHELRQLVYTHKHRFDLRVALAETLWLAKSYEDADMACQALLADLPNCLKANLILGQIWLNTERDDQARALLQRAQTLDPDNVVAQAVLGEQSPLPPRRARLPFKDEDAPSIDLPYLQDEDGFASDHDPIPEDVVAASTQRRASGESVAGGSPPGQDTRRSQVPGQETIGDAVTRARETEAALPPKESARERQSHKRVKELARAIDWEGMSLIDVRRQYIQDHPEDYEAQLDLARRLRDALKLDEALTYYSRLVAEDYELLAQVTHDLDLLSRLYPRTPAVKRLFEAAQEKGRRKPRSRS